MPILKIFRRRRGDAAWHCCANCAQWPARDYEETARAPESAALCAHCRELSDKLLCDAVRPQSIGPPEA